MVLPVLIIGEEPRVVVAIARSLHRRGVPVTVATLSAGAPIRSRAIRDGVDWSRLRRAPADFFAAISGLIRERGFDMVIPVSDTAMGLVAGCYVELSALAYVACPPPDVLACVLDKSRTMEAARRCGVTVPETWLVSGLDELERLGPQMRFPLVAKPRDKAVPNRLGFKTRYFQDLGELSDAFRRDLQFGNCVLLQEYCRGDGVGIAALLHGGSPVALFQHRRLKELPASGGVSVMAVSEPVDSELRDLALDLLRGIGWQGIAMVEFKQDRASRRAVLMEINGRYWGTLSLAVRAGLDFPLYHWQLAHGEAPQLPSQYRTGLRWRWLAGDLTRLHDLFTEPADLRHPRGRELVRFFADMRPSNCPAIGSVSDPLPALQEFLRRVRMLVASDLRAVLRRALPASLRAAVRDCRYLEPEARSWYLRRRIARALGLRRDSAWLPQPVRSPLFVCHGNILRSPMAEALLREYLAGSMPGLEIRSAGLFPRAGRPADARGLALAPQFGVSLAQHRSQPLDRELVESSDAIFVMDFLNEARVLTRFPEAAGKLHMLGAWRDSRGQVEIPDPYGGDSETVRQCYQVVEGCVRRLAAVLSAGRTPEPGGVGGEAGRRLHQVQP